MTDTAKEFLNEAALYHLGDLPTEMQNPKTVGLAEKAIADLPGAISLIQSIDVEAMSAIEAQWPALEKLFETIQSALTAGDRVFLAGCGATGRLALTLESLWKEFHPEDPHRVISFMAGGDLALVRSVENFEDHPEFGKRQLFDLGFQTEDLLIAITEGGETPFVIGAAEAAAQISTRKPWFLYCNPDEILLKKVKRSRQVIENPKIEKISLVTGPMSLSGSTRLQATSVLMWAVGFALYCKTFSEMQAKHQELKTWLQKSDLSLLEPFVERETEIYQKGRWVFYETMDFGLTIFADVTERHPTFNVPAFENQQDTKPIPSTPYPIFTGASDALQAWKHLLKRDPRAIEWSGYASRVGKDRLLGFDFSEKARANRLIRLGQHHTFLIAREDDGISLEYDEIKRTFPFPRDAAPGALAQNIILKTLLNIHSTLVMGRLSRFQSNVMTWVRPTNGKLIDRAIRYVQFLFQSENATAPPYEVICEKLFEIVDQTPPDQSIVLKTYQLLKKS